MESVPNMAHVVYIAGGLTTLDPIADVEEGQEIEVCVNLICSGSVLGCPLTVYLDVTGSAKTGLD